MAILVAQLSSRWWFRNWAPSTMHVSPMASEGPECSSASGQQMEEREVTQKFLMGQG